MNSQKQKLLLTYMISSPDVYALCSPIVKPQYFFPEYRNLVTFLHHYFDEYNALPNASQIQAETQVELTVEKITKDQLSYCCDEIEKFCKQQAMGDAVVKAAAILEDSVTKKEEVDYGKIDNLVKEAFQISLHKSVGLSLFENVAVSLREATKNKPVPIHWPDFDENLEGGLRRQEMLLLAANSGGGKSVVMKNIATQVATLEKLNVLYISLELPASMIMKRFASILSRVAPRNIEEKIDEVSKIVEATGHNSGDIIVEEMPVGTKPHQIRAFLKEFELLHNYIPDVLIVDYLDLMHPNERVDLSDAFTKDKLVSEQLRQILLDYNMIGITASQLNRSAVNVLDHNHSHIAGGISKINTTDYFVTIQLSEIMKASGQIAFQFGKTRSSDAVGKTIYMGWDRSCLRVYNKNESKGQLSTPKIPRTPTDPSIINSKNNSKLLNLFDD